jgi:hypothetical protein
MSPPSQAFLASFAVAAVCLTRRRSIVHRPDLLESLIESMIGSSRTWSQRSEAMEEVFRKAMLEVSIHESDILTMFDKLGKAAQAGRPNRFDRPGMEKLARGQADVLVVEYADAAPMDVYLLLAGWAEVTQESCYALPFELVWVILDDWSVVARFGRTDSTIRILFEGQRQNGEPKVKYAGYRVLPRTVEPRPRWTSADFKHRLM